MYSSTGLTMPAAVAIITTNICTMSLSTKRGYKKGRPKRDDDEEDDDNEESRRKGRKYNSNDDHDNINDDDEDKVKDKDKDSNVIMRMK